MGHFFVPVGCSVFLVFTRVYGSTQRNVERQSEAVEMISLVGDASGATFSFRVLPPLGKANVRGLCGAISALHRFSPGCVGVAARHDRCICGRLKGKLCRHAHRHHHPKAITITTTLRGGCGVAAIPRVLYDNFSHRSARCMLLSLRFLNVASLLMLHNSGTGRRSTFMPRGGNCGRTVRLRRRVGSFGGNMFMSNSPVGMAKAPFDCKMTYCPRGRRRSPGVRRSVC